MAAPKGEGTRIRIEVRKRNVFKKQKKNIFNTFLGISHLVLVRVSVLIDGPAVWNNTHSFVLLVDNKYGTVELA